MLTVYRQLSRAIKNDFVSVHHGVHQISNRVAQLQFDQKCVKF